MNNIGLEIEEGELEELGDDIASCEFVIIWFDKIGVVDRILRLLFGLVLV